MKISVIIPAYNEHMLIEKCLDQFSQDDGTYEIIVVDQSPGEETKKLVERYTEVMYVRSSGRSRAATMNHGAREARGEILLFLHVDCVLPDSREKTLGDIDGENIGRGGFVRRHEPSLRATRIADWRGKWLAIKVGYMLGDNALWVRKDVFERVGGYWEEKLFEDVNLCEKLRKIAHWKLIQDPVVCSSRKFIQSGPWKAFWIMLLMQLLFQGGMSVERLKKMYAKLKN